jgi:hypothetical protein
MTGFLLQVDRIIGNAEARAEDRARLLRKQDEARDAGDDGREHGEQTQQGVGVEGARAPALETEAEGGGRREERRDEEPHHAVKGPERLPAPEQNGGDGTAQESDQERHDGGLREAKVGLAQPRRAPLSEAASAPEC